MLCVKVCMKRFQTRSKWRHPSLTLPECSLCQLLMAFRYEMPLDFLSLSASRLLVLTLWVCWFVIMYGNTHCSTGCIQINPGSLDVHATFYLACFEPGLEFLSQTVNTFRKRLKTNLFPSAFNSPYWLVQRLMICSTECRWHLIKYYLLTVLLIGPRCRCRSMTTKQRALWLVCRWRPGRNTLWGLCLNHSHSVLLFSTTPCWTRPRFVFPHPSSTTFLLNDATFLFRFR